MKLSIIIPCYNCSETIVRTLDSIVFQLSDDDEIILIDDCSSDSTLKIISNYQADFCNIKVFSQEMNQGPANARNLGVKVAKGDYISFIDSDDTVESDYLKAIKDVVENHNADLVSIRIQSVYGQNTTPLPLVRYRDKEEFLALSTGSLCSIISSKILWEGLELPNIRNAEDIATIPVLISRAKCIHHIEKPLYNYIHTSNSLSRRPNHEISLSFQKSFEFTIKHIDRNVCRESIEFHGIKTVIYGGILNSIKNNIPQKHIVKMLDQFETEFPNWYNNKFVVQYPLRKRVFLFLVKRHFFICANIFVVLHEFGLKLKSISVR